MSEIGRADEPSEIRSSEKLAGISTEQWVNMHVVGKAVVLIEHFAAGAVYDPVMCGFCQDLRDVLTTIKVDWFEYVK